MTPAVRAAIRCPDCRGTLDDEGAAFSCARCGRVFDRARGFADLRPEAAFAEQTKYLDRALHAEAKHASVAPPLLQAGVRQRMLARMLRLGPGDLAADLGCGSGRSLVWNLASGATLVGVDVSPYFAAQALATGNLVLGDLRQLPFADGAIDKAYCLDVFEHLSPEGLATVLGEIARVVRPGGRVFVYSHVRKNHWLAGGLRAVNALARALERIGLLDLAQERLRKSDHRNPLADIPDLERVLGRAGFRIVTIRYYTPMVGAFIENILLRSAEHALRRWTRRGPLGTETRGGADEIGEARAAVTTRVAEGGVLGGVLRALTTLMMIDIVVLGHVRSGPFFAVIERESRTTSAP